MGNQVGTYIIIIYLIIIGQQSNQDDSDIIRSYYLTQQNPGINIMDDSSPLAMQFKQLDADGDNKLNVDEVYQLLKLLGRNIYKGSVTSAARMLNIDEVQEENKKFFNFSQFKQFYESLQNSLKHDIWKGKYKLLSTIKQIKTDNQMGQTGQKQESATAAPGAKPAIPEDSGPFKGDVQITVGPTNQNYNSFIHVNVEKTPKAESKPFLKITFDQSSNQKAKQLQTRFKKVQSNVFELIKSSDPESSQILDRIHIMTNVAGSKLIILVTTSNDLLIQLGNITAQFIDRILGTSFEAKIDFKHQFTVQIDKFLDKTSDYTMYNALTKNYHLKLVWSAFNFKEAAKQLFKNLGVFKDFVYDKADPILLTLIGILHTQVCEVNLVFDNAQFNQAEQQTKIEILQGIGQLNTLLSEQQHQKLQIYQAIESFEDNIQVQASIGDWKAQVQIKIKDVKSLFSKKQNNGDNQQLFNPPPVQQHAQQTGIEKHNINKKKLSQSSSSQKSIGKKPLNKSTSKKSFKQSSSKKSGKQSSSGSLTPQKKVKKVSVTPPKATKQSPKKESSVKSSSSQN